MNIFVGNLSFKTTEQELQREFEAFGEVGSVKIITDHNTLKSRGFAFVEMKDRDQALAAIAGINGKELAGQTLKVNEAKPREAQVLDQAGAASATKIEVAVATITKMKTVVSMTARVEAEAATAAEVEVGLALAVDQVGANVPARV
jgi:cold-inducible RNA-binding protein